MKCLIILNFRSVLFIIMTNVLKLYTYYKCNVKVYLENEEINHTVVQWRLHTFPLERINTFFFVQNNPRFTFQLVHPYRPVRDFCGKRRGGRCIVSLTPNTGKYVLWDLLVWLRPIVCKNFLLISFCCVWNNG